jgi:hypothetical protein
MRARSSTWFLALQLVAATNALANGYGIRVDAERLDWPRWQVRLQLNAEFHSMPAANGLAVLQAAPRARSGSLFGDYYLASPRLGNAGGLRLTSGVVVGQRGSLLGPGSPASLEHGFAGTVTHNLAPVPASLDAGAETTLTWPYLGVGYSGNSLRGGWGVSADLGLAAQNPGAIRLGRTFGSQPFDELVRDMRLTPVLQLGVSYRF